MLCLHGLNAGLQKIQKQVNAGFQNIQKQVDFQHSSAFSSLVEQKEQIKQD